MMETSFNLVMTPEEFRLIKEYVAATFGLTLENGREEALSLKLLPHIRKLRLATFSEYYVYLKFGPGAGEERIHLFLCLPTMRLIFFVKKTVERIFSGDTPFSEGTEAENW